jgi:hypothetical protein
VRVGCVCVRGRGARGGRVVSDEQAQHSGTHTLVLAKAAAMAGRVWCGAAAQQQQERWRPRSHTRGVCVCGGGAVSQHTPPGGPVADTHTHTHTHTALRLSGTHLAVLLNMNEKKSSAAVTVLKPFWLRVCRAQVCVSVCGGGGVGGARHAHAQTGQPRACTVCKASTDTRTHARTHTHTCTSLPRQQPQLTAARCQCTQ